MAKLGSGEDAYELLGKGRRPRMKYARRLSPDAAVRRIRRLTVDAGNLSKVRTELERVGLRPDPSRFEEQVREALLSKRLTLFRNFTLSPPGSSSQIAIPMSSLLPPEPEPTAEASPAASGATAEATQAPATGGANSLATLLAAASTSGAALCHNAMTCTVCSTH